MNDRIIFNADDFGISPGVNAAIAQAHREGILNSASLMINQKYAPNAVALTKQMPSLELGVHVNLTNEFPVAEAKDIPLLVDRCGKFKNGFVKLLLLALFKGNELKRQVKIEVEAQIQKAIQLGVDVQHIDSHRHVHMIPGLFAVFLQIKQQYTIPRMRVINECGLLTILNNKGFRYLFDGSLIKYSLLKFFSYVNGYSSKTYFYTMLYTCRLAKERLAKVVVPRGYEKIEIMIHPGFPKIDQSYQADVFDNNILSNWRDVERETLLDKSIVNGFVFEGEYPWIIAMYHKIELWWFRLNQKIRYLLVGGFNTVFAYVVFAFLLEILGLSYPLALTVQYFITVNVSIFTMRYYVFQSLGNFWQEYVKAWTVYIGMFCFNSVALIFLIEICKMGELKAQALYIVVSTILTYLLHKYFSFHKKIKEK